MTTKKQERISMIKQMVENDHEPLNDVDEFEAISSVNSTLEHEEGTSIGKFTITTKKNVLSKATEKPMSTGLPPFGRKSKKHWSKIKKCLHKMRKCTVRSENDRAT